MELLTENAERSTSNTQLSTKASEAKRSKDSQLFRFRAFQVDDLARWAMHDGAILGWDPGLFKSGAAYVLPWIKCARRVLIVAPEELHEQIMGEGRDKFGIETRPLLNHEQFYKDKLLRQFALDDRAGVLDSTLQPFNASTPPTYWITSYSALGLNGGDMWQPKEKENGELILNSNIIGRRQSHPLYREEYDFSIGESKNGIRCLFYPNLALLCANLFDCVVCDEGVAIKSNDSYCSLGVRMMQPRIRIPLTATPIKNRLPDIFWLAHWACGSHEKGCARWPYQNTNEAKEQFSNEHMLIEQNHTKEARNVELTGRFKSFKKRTSQICNIHRLWKLLGPVVLRRRKDDTGEEIVSKTVIPIRTKPGSAQQIVYKFHVENKPDIAKNGKEMSRFARVVAQYQNLRQAALCPDSPNLSEVGLSAHTLRMIIKSEPDGRLTDEEQRLTHRLALVAHKGERTPFEGERDAALAIVEKAIKRKDRNVDIEAILKVAPSMEERLRPLIVAPDLKKQCRSWTDFNPKQAANLKLIEEWISKGEQVVVMSPFQHFSLCLYRRLIEANVSVCLLDGNISPKKRGQLAKQFKRKKFAVLIAGIQSMGKGHSFECARILILPSLEWAYDGNMQCIDRVHRLVSEKPVIIYAMVTTNTIDERLESVFCEKRDSSNLALDGRLFADKTDEINLAELLSEAIRNFNPNAETIPEKDIEKEWEASLRQKLRHAEERFREFHPPIVADIDGNKPTAGEIAAAIAPLSSLVTDHLPLVTSIVNCIPSATIGALIGSADRAKIDKVRAMFSQFCSDNCQSGSDWKQGWRMFESSGALEKI